MDRKRWDFDQVREWCHRTGAKNAVLFLAVLLLFTVGLYSLFGSISDFIMHFTNGVSQNTFEQDLSMLALGLSTVAVFDIVVKWVFNE